MNYSLTYLSIFLQNIEEIILDESTVLENLKIANQNDLLIFHEDLENGIKNSNSNLKTLSSYIIHAETWKSLNLNVKDSVKVETLEIKITEAINICLDVLTCFKLRAIAQKELNI